MENEIRRVQHLAAYTLLKEMYDSGKNNIFDIISEFLKDAIIEESIVTIIPSEIRKKLFELYSIEVPVSVVVTSLKKISGLKRENKEFIVISREKIKSAIDNSVKEEIELSNQKIIDKLYIYIEEKGEKKLSFSDKQNVIKSLSLFLMVESNGHDYSELISAFIIENSDDDDFVNKLDSIKEGVIIYQGLNYDNTPNSVSSWNKEITFYLETDVIFNSFGLNGIIFQNIFNDFYKLVNRINKDKGKILIKLRYLKEIEEDIDSFYYKAECIKNYNEELDPSITAMKSILEGCDSASDVQDRKSDLFSFLLKSDIVIESSVQYYESSNHSYNLEGGDICSDKRIPDHYKNDYYLKLLSHVNIRRKGIVTKKVQEAGYLMITNNSKINNMSTCINEKNDGYSIPLSQTLMSLTTKLWVQTNTGLGTKELPTSFNMISKAQVLLSKHLNDKIATKYYDLRKNVKEGNIDDAIIKSRYANLIEQSKKPEEIKKNDIEEIMHSLKIDELKDFVINYEKEKKHAVETTEAKVKLEKVVVEFGGEIEKKNLQLKNMNVEVLASREIAYKLCSDSYNEQLTKKTLCDEKSRKMRSRFKYGIIGIIIVYLILVTVMIIKVDWNILEPIFTYVPIVVICLLYIYQIKTYRKWKFLDIFERYFSSNDNKIHKKNSFSLTKFKETQVQLEEISKAMV